MRAMLITGAAAVVLAGCGRSPDGPAVYEIRPPTADEIRAAPLDPLAIPPVLSLPVPAPGTANRADRDDDDTLLFDLSVSEGG